MYTLFGTLIALGILVTFHEFGHFWVARRCGVKVLRFSVGFGMPLIKWRDRQGTEFVIAAIPLGGYVKMLDEREGPVAESMLNQAFTQKTVKQRIAIVAAGPIANFLLAIVFFWLLALLGSQEIRPVIGSVAPESLAEQAGLQAGMELTQVDQTPTHNWGEVAVALMRQAGSHKTLEISTKTEVFATEQQHRVPLQGWLRGADEVNPLTEFGLSIWQPEIPSIVAQVQEGSPAAVAGLQLGDQITALNGEPYEHWQGLTEKIRQLPNQPVSLTIVRAGQSQTLAVTLSSASDNPQQGFLGVGVQPGEWPASMLREVSFSPWSALPHAVAETWNTSLMTLQFMGKMLVGDLSVKNLSGPITIAKVAGDSAENGIKSFLRFLALLSISLGVLNLLPIPVLDGGHLLFYCIEWARGRPLSDKIQNFGVQVGVILILGVMLLALFNDLGRL